MSCTDPCIGRVAYSKAGRDKGRLFIVVGIVDEDFVLVADGDLRRVERPKRKRIKHLKYTGLSAHQIAEEIMSGRKPFNADLKNAIREVQDLLMARKD